MRLSIGPVESATTSGKRRLARNLPSEPAKANKFVHVAAIGEVCEGHHPRFAALQEDEGMPMVRRAADQAYAPISGMF
jgi:hypothetical protein